MDSTPQHARPHAPGHPPAVGVPRSPCPRCSHRWLRPLIGLLLRFDPTGPCPMGLVRSEFAPIPYSSVECVCLTPVRKSRPKWLRLSECTVSTLCILEHRSDTRLLTAGKTAGGECLLGAASTLIAVSILRLDDPFRQALMHGNVVQVTKGVL